METPPSCMPPRGSTILACQAIKNIYFRVSKQVPGIRNPVLSQSGSTELWIKSNLRTLSYSRLRSLATSALLSVPYRIYGDPQCHEAIGRVVGAAAKMLQYHAKYLLESRRHALSRLYARAISAILKICR